MRTAACVVLLALLCLGSIEAKKHNDQPHGKPHNKPHDKPHNLPQLTDRPVIGILTLPMESDFGAMNGTSYIAGSYVGWVEQGGARVVPLRVDHDWSELAYLVSNLNGVLFTGGGADFWVNGTSAKGLVGQNGELTSYAKTGCYIYNLVKKLNDAGQYYPIWGTCLGFQLLHVCAYTNEKTVGRFDGEPPYAQRNLFTENARKSRLFGSKMGGFMKELMEQENLHLLSHLHGIAPWEYHKFRNLSDAYSVLATMHDRNGNTFVSIIEGNHYPFYGTQFHPEKNIYEWDISTPTPHGHEAVAMASYLSLFFLGEARRNANSFASEEELKPWLIYNWDPYFLDGYFMQIFQFY